VLCVLGDSISSVDSVAIIVVTSEEVGIAGRTRMRSNPSPPSRIHGLWRNKTSAPQGRRPRQSLAERDIKSQPDETGCGQICSVSIPGTFKAASSRPTPDLMAPGYLISEAMARGGEPINLVLYGGQGGSAVQPRGPGHPRVSNYLAAFGCAA